MNRLVWLVSYPKSGNTWFRALWNALRDDAVNVNALTGGGVGVSPALVEEATGLTFCETAPAERAALRHAAVQALLAGVEGVVLEKLHDAYACTPQGAPVWGGAGVRVLYIVRDPRDVALSFAHHEDKPVDAIIDRMADPAATVGRIVQGVPMDDPLGTWSNHVTGWLDQSEIPVHLLRYEDMHADPLVTIGAALDFAGLSHSPDRIGAALEVTRIDRLRAQEATDGFRERPFGAAPFFRDGKAGGWRTALGPARTLRLEKDHGPVMRRMGYQVGPDAL